MPEAWTCPSCGRGVAPHIPTCDHGGQMVTVHPRTLPDAIPPTQSPMPPPTTAGEPDWRKIFEEQMNRLHNGDPKHPWWNPNPFAPAGLDRTPDDWRRHAAAARQPLGYWPGGRNGPLGNTSQTFGTFQRVQ